MGIELQEQQNRRAELSDLMKSLRGDLFICEFGVDHRAVFVLVRSAQKVMAGRVSRKALTFFLNVHFITNKKNRQAKHAYYFF